MMRDWYTGGSHADDIAAYQALIAAVPAAERVTVEAARALALNFIRYRVERGDLYEWIKEGCGGSYGAYGSHAVQIGSPGIYGCPRPRFGADTITVGVANFVPCCYMFSLRELFDEIKSGASQLSLFDAAVAS